MIKNEANQHECFLDVETLIKTCPEKFQWPNPWSRYPELLLKHGDLSPDCNNWRWKKVHEKEKEKWQKQFQAIVQDPKVSFHYRVSIGGWLLSRVLKVVPEYIPGKSKT